ncbi:hypothetical protein ACJMK2_018811 [Sinanodonta woodiana]|uniref:THD domain-containing protein n=1 Tax=Sinanodonta woodiana TaxID=1069815 RepID=A0ABD3UGK9_SINWO
MHVRGMEHQSNQLFLSSDRSTSNSRSTNNYSDLSNQLHYDQYNASSNRLPSDDSSNTISNRLPSDDSGFSCKCKHYSGSFPERASHPSEDNRDANSRKDETRRKSVSFSLGSSSNITDENLCVREINIDSDSSTNSDPSFISNQSTSSFQRNGNSNAQNKSCTSSHSRTCIHENADRNTTFNRKRSVYSDSDENNIMLSDCNHIASKLNTRTTLPMLGLALNTDIRPDQRSVLHHQQLPDPPCLINTKDQHNFPQCVPCTCHDHTRPNIEETDLTSRPNIFHEVKRNFDPESSAPLLGGIHHIASHEHYLTSPEPCVLLHDNQPSKTVTTSALSKTRGNKMADEEGTVATPRSCCMNKKKNVCFVMLVVFNIISLAASGFIFFNHRTYQECPLCKDVIEQVAKLKGGDINSSAIQTYLKENNKNGRCCVNHAFIFNLMTQTNLEIQAKHQNHKSIEDNIQNSSKMAALQLKSLKGTIPFKSEHPDDGFPGPMEMIRWDFHSKDRVIVGPSWDVLDSDTKIKIPFTGVYFIYASVQYRYKTERSAQPADNMPNADEFLLFISLYKYSDKEHKIIGNVTQHCKIFNMTIEHNSSLERIVRLKKHDEIILAVSNTQSLRDESSLHQIGFIKVD